MKFGLNESEFEFLQQHLIRPLKKERAKVYIFGSRVSNKHHKFSDVDILFIEDDTTPIDTSMISRMLTFFEDSQFPYKIDLVNNKGLAKSYRQNVESTMVEV